MTPERLAEIRKHCEIMNHGQVREPMLAELLAAYDELYLELKQEKEREDD